MLCSFYTHMRDGRPTGTHTHTCTESPMKLSLHFFPIPSSFPSKGSREQTRASAWGRARGPIQVLLSVFVRDVTALAICSACFSIGFILSGGETLASTGRTCKLHTERPGRYPTWVPGNAATWSPSGNRTQDLLAVRRQC